MSELIGLITFGLASLVAAANFYLSVLRYPIHKLLGAGEYRFESGLPAIGTLLLAVAAICLWRFDFFRPLAALVAVIDTAGLPWFVAVMFWQSFIRKQP